MVKKNKTPNAVKQNRGFQNTRRDYNAHPSLEKILRALYCVPADEREIWLRVGMALMSELGDNGFFIWNKWSQTSASYNEKTALAVWKSFKPGKISIATLFYIAAQNGWKYDGEISLTPAEIVQREEAKRAMYLAWMNRQSIIERRQMLKADLARAIWNAAKPCKGHPYLEIKGINPHGLRVGNWPLWRKDGSSWLKSSIPGALLVPMSDPMCVPMGVENLQAIWAETPQGLSSSKLFLPGAKKSGLFHVIGEPTPTILIPEGLATGKTLFQQSGFQTFVAFDCGNLKAVAKIVRKSNPSAKIVICADNDRNTPGNPGITKAREAALAVNGFISIPVFPEGSEGTDFNDLHLLRMNGGIHVRV
jgi:putative DNA primase/helicase